MLEVRVFPEEPKKQKPRPQRARTGFFVARAAVHKFRHTFAINFLRNGGSVLELQRMLGHEHLSTVKIYASLAESDIQEAQRRASPADNWKLG